MSSTTTKASKATESFKDYFDSLALYEWWEQFTTSFNDNGTFKYQTVHQFIKVKAKNEKQRKFLWYILGPAIVLEGDETNGHSDYSAFKQFDWADKREQGFWYSNANTEKLKQEATKAYGAMDEVRAVGKVNLDDICRIKTILDQLDREYGGQLNIPSFSSKENALRIATYTSLRSQLQIQLHSAQLMYAKTRGVDMNQLSELVAVAGASILGTLSGHVGKEDPALTAKIGTMDKLRDMLLTKSTNYEMPLPDKDMEAIIKDTGRIIHIDQKKVQ